MKSEVALKRHFVFIFSALVLILALSFLKEQRSRAFENSSFEEILSVKELKFRSVEQDFSEAKSFHSSALVNLGDKLVMLYFAGSKEGARDVKIYQRVLASNDEKDLESAPKVLLDAPLLSKMSDKFIKKLGNPVIFKDSKNRVHVFVVGVSLGGWATSKIYQLRLDEDLLNLSFVSELKLSALANFSHLVRTPGVPLQQGAFVLPIYHELADKYALLAYFDDEGRFAFVKRLNALKSQLQPSLIATAPKSCLIFYRNHRAYENDAFMQACKGGVSEFNAPFKTNLKSYDSSSVLFKAFDEVFLLHNDGNKSAPRARLSLYHLQNINDKTAQFSLLKTLATGAEVSYPSVALDKENVFISFTQDRRKIEVLRLGFKDLQTWLENLKNLQDEPQDLPNLQISQVSQVLQNARDVQDARKFMSLER